MTDVERIGKRVAGTLLDLLFPRHCPFCDRLLLSGETLLCRTCRVELPWTEGTQSERSGEFFTVCAAPLWYQDAVRQSHHRYKFQGRRGYAEAYAALMSQCVRKYLAGRFDQITWVPLSRRGLRARGYDQARLIAERMALALGVECLPLLDKPRHNAPQSGISGAAARRANVLGVYAARSGDKAVGRRILLVDDVMTTGATLSECARVLHQAGAADVCCAVFAFTPERKSF